MSDKILQTRKRITKSGITLNDASKRYDCVVLFAPMFGSGEVYAINTDGNIVHEWKLPWSPGLYGYLLPNGNLLYLGKTTKKSEVDFTFIPKTKDIYKKKRSKKIIINNKKNVMCGKFRKGHFEGVVDVVDRLLNIIGPKYMFLGEKDFQQLFLIKKYVKNKFKVKIIPCKTIRDKNYVALSSRNKLLSKNQFKIAGKVAKKLKKFKKKIKNKRSLTKKIHQFKMNLKNIYGIKIDYLEIRNEKNLSVSIKNSKFRLFIAYYIGNVRLIDNF